MEVVAFLALFVLLGIAVTFVAFSGGPGRARDVYLTRGGRGFRIAIVVLYIALGIAVPALAIGGRGESQGGVGALRQASLPERQEQGKQLFLETCASCHNLDAVNARGVTGPDLDEIGEMTRERVATAIEQGGTGQNRMPAGLLQGREAEDVAIYVAAVAGR